LRAGTKREHRESRALELMESRKVPIQKKKIEGPVISGGSRKGREKTLRNWVFHYPRLLSGSESLRGAGSKGQSKLEGCQENVKEKKWKKTEISGLITLNSISEDSRKSLGQSREPKREKRKAINTLWSQALYPSTLINSSAQGARRK